MSFDSDKSIAIELLYFIQSTPALYKSMTLPIIYNLQKKVDTGVYSPLKAVVMWDRLTAKGAELYCKENDCGPVRTVFPKSIQRMTSALLASHYSNHVNEPKEIRTPRSNNRTRRANPFKAKRIHAFSPNTNASILIVTPRDTNGNRKKAWLTVKGGEIVSVSYRENVRVPSLRIEVSRSQYRSLTT